MTTNVTVKTHSWPVRVTTVDRYVRNQVCNDTQQLVVSKTTTVETVPANSERTFYITDSRAIAFEELPLPPADEAGI